LNSIHLKKVLQKYKKTTYSANYFIRLPKKHSQMAQKCRKTCLVVKKTSLNMFFCSFSQKKLRASETASAKL